MINDNFRYGTYCEDLGISSSDIQNDYLENLEKVVTITSPLRESLDSQLV